MRAFITTSTGMVFEMSKSLTQEIYVRVQDPNGDPEVQGGRVKIYEHCSLLTVQVGKKFHVRGFNRYSDRLTDVRSKGEILSIIFKDQEWESLTNYQFEG